MVASQSGCDKDMQGIGSSEPGSPAAGVTHELETEQHTVTPMPIWPWPFRGQFNKPSHIPHGMRGLSVSDSQWISTSTL